MIRSKWTFPLLFAGMLTGYGCDDNTPAGQDAGADAPPADMTPPPDMTVPPPDMTVPPPDMQPPPPDMTVPPPDMVVPPPDVPMATARTTQTQGSAIAVTSDDRAIVAVNRTANSVAVFGVSTAGGMTTLSRSALLDTPDGEPWAAVVGNDDNAAYVILRKARQVVRVTGLRGTPALDATRATVGSCLLYTSPSPRD